MEAILLFLLTFLSLSSTSLASSSSLLRAADILSDSGYLSMALTLRITIKHLHLESSATTVFAPSDPAFAKSGQPSLVELQYHILPITFSRENFTALSFGSRIPTLCSNRSLIVTASSDYSDEFSINGVSLQGSLLFDDERVVIYGIDDFFNSSYEIPPRLVPQEGFNGSIESVDQFGNASGLLISKGYSIMAALLNVQLFTNQTRLTIFAPVDEAMEANARDISDYSVVFRQHVVPRFLPWQDMGKIEDGTILSTFSDGFWITVTRSGDVLVLNGIPVICPDMYYSDWLVAHGINQLLPSLEKQVLIGDSFSELEGEEVQNQHDYTEYEVP
ncbi:hypothetical protein HS088_TW11G00521 [Tripterygium wilfordii]|uniref:FAS1 domain-containing protein n=1 Tax=Tripterygium wilfordii TaxID=458696 RepID=A0A7J7D266_TRIWF|nr:putative fasciclin-like arabinogalactan protein 20 [Tripterygium wilfordii]KAF5740452.1 hypothetical protein HS088_TW11G00521 [Tripterygium wilfordii]